MGEHARGMTRGVARAPFGVRPSGDAVELFTITNVHGTEVRVMTYGAIIVSIRTPDRDGQLGDVVLGYDELRGYTDESPYFGAVVGRYGNRISRGRFSLDGRSVELARNNGENHLHGGRRGFDKVVWRAEACEDDTGAGVELAHVSRDGDEGYPGTLEARVRYSLTDRDELAVDYLATTDRPTVINMTQHSYFNLGGGARDILGHELTIGATRYTPVDSGLIPTGELAPVAGTPFDFRSGQLIGARIDAPDSQLAVAGGYDHNFVLDGVAGALRHAARAADPESGRVLDVHTTEPGMQFYAGNFLDGRIRGKAGRVYGHRHGFCLETQHFPDSPNQPNFPTTVLRPGGVYRSRTVFAFSTIDRLAPVPWASGG